MKSNQLDIRKASKAYGQQLNDCKYKPKTKNGAPVEMKLTFPQWLRIWICSGRWNERGTRKGSYCMARHNDEGHYEEGNVSIILHSQNTRDAQLGVKRGPSHLKGLKTGPNPRKANKGKNNPMYGVTNPRFECPHCRGLFVKCNLNKWHGEKCKMKGEN